MLKFQKIKLLSKKSLYFLHLSKNDYFSRKSYIPPEAFFTPPNYYFKSYRLCS